MLETPKTTRMIHPRKNQEDWTTWNTEDLCRMAAAGLAPMMDPSTGLFCFRLNRTPSGLVREGLSHRYSIMTLLGIHRYRTLAQASCDLDERSGFDQLIKEDWIDNIGDLGLVLWLCAVWPNNEAGGDCR